MSPGPTFNVAAATAPSWRWLVSGEVVIDQMAAEVMMSWSAVGLQYIRTFHDDVDEGLAGSELGGVEYAITRDEWRAANP